MNLQKVKNTSPWILSVILVIALLFQSLKSQHDEDKLVHDIISSYSDSVKYERLKNGALIATNTSLKLNSQKQIKEMASNLNDTIKEMLKKFKSVSNVTYVTNTFLARKDTIHYKQDIPCDFKPFKVRRGSDTSYKFVGTIGKDYFSIDSLSIKNKIAIVSGRKKIGFMKWDNGVDINNSNPLMITSNITSYQYVPVKKWYEKTWVHWIEGALIQSGVQWGIKEVVKSN